MRRPWRLSRRSRCVRMKWKARPRPRARNVTRARSIPSSGAASGPPRPRCFSTTPVSCTRRCRSATPPCTAPCSSGRRADLSSSCCARGQMQRLKRTTTKRCRCTRPHVPVARSMCSRRVCPPTHIPDSGRGENTLSRARSVLRTTTRHAPSIGTHLPLASPSLSLAARLPSTIAGGARREPSRDPRSNPCRRQPAFASGCHCGCAAHRVSCAARCACRRRSHCERSRHAALAPRSACIRARRDC